MAIHYCIRATQEKVPITKEKNTQNLEEAFFKIINDGEAENEK